MSSDTQGVARTPDPNEHEHFDDDHFVIRIREGDESAFRELWERYHARLVRFARRYVHTDEAAVDVVQDMFFAVWVGRATLAPRTSVAAYLYRSVWHRAQQVVRHAQVERRYAMRVIAQSKTDPVGEPNAGEATVEADDRRALIDRLTARMTPRVREIFLMSREDGLTAPQIAAALNISTQVVYNQLSKAAKLMAEGLAALKDIR
jgi:RNA polymerase sigma-70 factor (ECF subfamily)